MTEQPVIKVGIVGDAFVGKSTMIYKLFGIDGQTLPTIFQTYTYQLNLGNTTYELHIMDTAGQENYASFIPQVLRDSDIVLIVFSINSSVSYEDVKCWYRRIKDVVKANAKFVIVGNKVDLASERQINDETAVAHAGSMGAIYIPISAKHGDGMDDLKKLLGKLCSEVTPQQEHMGPEPELGPRRKCC